MLGGPATNGPGIYFNNDVYPLNKKEVRQAFAYIIDRQENAKVAMGEAGRGIQYEAGFTDLQVEAWLSPETIAKLNQYPVDQTKKTDLLLALLRKSDSGQVLVFTRTKHRANRLADQLTRHGVGCERIHGNRSQAQRTAALAGFKDGKFKVLVATDIAARGIDVEALSHVVNFDVPHVPEDYIHRVGRTARAELKGDAFTFVAPDEEGDLRQIERAIGKRLPRVTVPDFDYSTRPVERFEVPIAERIAQIRARKAEERKRAREKAERRAAHENAMVARQQRPAPSSQPARAAASPQQRSHSGRQSQDGQARRPQPHGPRRDGHVQGPARPGHPRPPQS